VIPIGRERFVRWLAPLAAAGALVAVASIFLAAPYDRWLHSIEAAAFLGALACALAFDARGERGRAFAARAGAAFFLAGLFLMLLPLSCGA